MAKYLQTINVTEDEVKRARLEPFEERNKNIVIEFDKIFINENFNVYNKFVELSNININVLNDIERGNLK